MGGGQSAGSEGNTKAEMGGAGMVGWGGGQWTGAGLRQTMLVGGWTAHKTQEDEEKKMRGQNGGEPKTDGKGWSERKGDEGRGKS